MEQDSGGQKAGDQFQGVEVSVEEAGDGMKSLSETQLRR